MKRIICLIIVFAFLSSLVSCGSKKTSTVPDITYSEITITLSERAQYLVSFVLPGSKDYKKTESADDGTYVTYKTDNNGTLTLNLNAEYIKLDPLFKKSSTLDIVVSTLTDINIRNALNEKHKIDFYLKAGADNITEFCAGIASLDVNINDSFPSEVYSLAFPNAVFVVKLEFAASSEPTQSGAKEQKYEVFIYDSGDETGKKRIGKVCKSMKYWDAPFYKNEIASMTGKIVVRKFATETNIEYEGGPIEVSFDENGICGEGRVITIRLPEEFSKWQ